MNNIFTASIPVEQQDRKPFPFIYRFTNEHSVGVKTYVGQRQYGEVCSLNRQQPDFTKERLLDQMEADLREKVGAL